MHFASPISWWLAVTIAVGIAAAAFISYRRPLVPLTPFQRGILTALRALTLAAIVLLLSRPTVLVPPAAAGDLVIPVLVDASRSMRIADADGETRERRAAHVLQDTLLPLLSTQGRVEILTFGDARAGLTPVTPATLDTLDPAARQTDLSSAIAAAADRYRGQRIAGIIVLSDGADTAPAVPGGASALQSPPIFTIGIGSPEGLPDREVAGLTAGDPKLDRALVDLHVSATSRGFGRAPFQVRVLANGQVLETRRVTPPSDLSPIEETFAVSPDPLNPTVYTAEIVADSADAFAENDVRSVLVSPASRKRRVLMLAGAPGYEHSFLARALAQDPGLEIDWIVRKGKDDDNRDTFFVQAPAARGSLLTTGFPSTREALFAYDALIIANLEADYFTRAQFAAAADFVTVRGGGLLVLGGRSFESRSLTGTPLEEALPVELSDRRGGAVSPLAIDEAPAPHNTVVVTAEGQNHPIMRIGASIDSSRKLWAALPPLAGIAPVGGPRRGASVLAVATTSQGAVVPVVAVQRYGRGRSMVFSGEASWRWRMLQPSSDRSYEFFWRQALRWLSSEAPERLTIEAPSDPEAGDTVAIEIEARDPAFVPQANARVTATMQPPGADAAALSLRSDGRGRFRAVFAPQASGLYRLHVDARGGPAPIDAIDQWLNVGGGDREFADPRLNEALLQRLARQSGGRYVRAADAGSIVSDLTSAIPRQTEPVRRDLWHEPWAYALVVGLLASEWILRRRWGLR
jgi:uncharacterized membrane protein